MAALAAPLTRSTRTIGASRAIATAGLCCGVLDLAAAFVTAGLKGTGPIIVLHSVAGAVLGRAAYQGGLPTAALGLAMHFCVAAALAGIFYALSRRWVLLIRRPLPFGLLYGAAAYFAMYWVVIPLCAVARKLYLSNVTVRFLPFSFEALAIHLFCVGLPIALVLRHLVRASRE